MRRTLRTKLVQPCRSMHLDYSIATVYVAPWPIFHGRNLHSWNSTGANKAGARNVSLRAFRRRVVRHWHHVGCRAIHLGKSPKRGVINTVVYGSKSRTLCGLGKSIKALVRWATGKRLSDRFPKLSLITLSPPRN